MNFDVIRNTNSKPLGLKSLIAVVLFGITYFSCYGQETGTFRMRQVGNDQFVNGGWELTWGTNNKLWVTERIGKTVLMIDPETGEKDLLYEFTDAIQDENQNGVLGMALHPELGSGTGNDYLYVSYTYEQDQIRGQKLVRLSYSETAGDGTLSDEIDVLIGLPSSNDHNSGRLIFGPDQKLYYTIGDQGANRSRNACNPVLSQVLPTLQEVDNEDFSHYVGKTLRLNLDGSIPEDNPTLNGVISHVFTYGHRNAQGLVFGSTGLLYSDEHSDNTDDEVNLLTSGGNYGWPYIAGYQDDQVYQYCNYSAIENCDSDFWSNYECHEQASPIQESTWDLPDFMPPIATMFTVDNDYDFFDPSCSSNWICRPNVAPSAIDIYEQNAVPDWNNSLLIVSLKRGRVYRYKLSEDGQSVDQNYTEHWNTVNRYRDIAVHPDGTKFYIVTDLSGGTEAPGGVDRTSNLEHPGSILEFSYEALDDDNTLSSLTVSEGTLEPDFDPEIKSYSVILTENTDSFKVTAEASSPYATLQVGSFAEIPGTDNITVTSESGAANQYVIEVEVAITLSAPSFQESISVFPVPFEASFKLTGNFTGNEEMRMHDVSGKKVSFSKELIRNAYEIALPDAGPGIYLLDINTSTGRQTLRISKR